MFGLFKKESELEKLQKQHKKLMQESFTLSKSNRSAGDAKYAEAEAIAKKIEELA
ncbi:Lacal_2735 family protein [Salibacteraceae bacterium]|nr:Lacal_2735 family protein [Salibacteraceae bacterium]